MNVIIMPTTHKHPLQLRNNISTSFHVLKLTTHTYTKNGVATYIFIRDFISLSLENTLYCKNFIRIQLAWMSLQECDNLLLTTSQDQTARGFTKYN